MARCWTAENAGWGGDGTVPWVVSGTQDRKEASLPDVWTAVFSRVLTPSSSHALLCSDLFFV